MDINSVMFVVLLKKYPYVKYSNPRLQGYNLPVVLIFVLSCSASLALSFQFNIFFLLSLYEIMRRYTKSSSVVLMYVIISQACADLVRVSGRERGRAVLWTEPDHNERVSVRRARLAEGLAQREEWPRAAELCGAPALARLLRQKMAFD